MQANNRVKLTTASDLKSEYLKRTLKRTSKGQGTIFISCGQYSDEEKRLGNSVADLITELTLFVPYFAENQRTVAGVTDHILRALDKCMGFIGIMHQRGEVVRPEGNIVRGSVWIEQEIAIMAFLGLVLDRKKEVLLYIQKGIAREGVRDKLLLNPISFESSDEVLGDLRGRLPTWISKAYPSYGKSIDVNIRYEEFNLTQERHDLRLLVEVENDGTELVREYYVDIYFPETYMNSADHLMTEIQSSRQGYRCFRVLGERQTEKFLKPRDKVIVLRIPYFVNTTMYRRQDRFHEKVILEYGVGDESPRRLEKSMKELQNF